MADSAQFTAQSANRLAGRITVRHREKGYLRLALPPELRHPQAGAAMETGLRQQAGILAAAVEADGACIAIRYADDLCAAQVARHLFALISALPGEALADDAPVAGFAGALQPLLDRLKTVLLPPGEPPSGSLPARLRPVLEAALTEKALINFFNDVLAFYLIKVHWELITKRWLKSPLAHGNAWLTVFYLVFLLVRYRKSK